MHLIFNSVMVLLLVSVEFTGTFFSLSPHNTFKDKRCSESNG